MSVYQKGHKIMSMIEIVLSVFVGVYVACAIGSVWAIVATSFKGIRNEINE
jgi:hypothetical protein